MSHFCDVCMSHERVRWHRRLRCWLCNACANDAAAPLTPKEQSK